MIRILAISLRRGMFLLPLRAGRYGAQARSDVARLSRTENFHPLAFRSQERNRIFRPTKIRAPTYTLILDLGTSTRALRCGAITRPQPLLALPLFHHLAKILEEVMRIVRTRRRLGMILHAEQWQRTMAQAFERVVIEVHVRQ